MVKQCPPGLPAVDVSLHVLTEEADVISYTQKVTHLFFFPSHLIWKKEKS